MPLLRFGKKKKYVKKFSRRFIAPYGKGGMKVATTGSWSAALLPGRRQYGQMLLNRVNPFPAGRWVEMVYADTFVLVGVTIVPLMGAPQIFQISNLYSPMYAGPGTSHQPYEYDQISGLYQYYKVYEFGWQITFYDCSAPSVFAGVSLTASNDPNFTLSVGNARSLMERPGCYFLNMTPDGSNVRTHSGRVKIWEVEGMPYNQFCANGAFEASTGGSPSRSGALQMAIGDLNSPVTPCTCRCAVKLFFKGRLWGTATQSGS